jgi:hypothetical protein
MSTTIRLVTYKTIASGFDFAIWMCRDNKIDVPGKSSHIFIQKSDFEKKLSETSHEVVMKYSKEIEAIKNALVEEGEIELFISW